MLGHSVVLPAARHRVPRCAALDNGRQRTSTDAHVNGRPGRRSDDSQMILKQPAPVSNLEPDLLVCGAPLRNRTVDLLLTIYPRADAVAICDDAAQARGGARCCRPTYLVITRGPGGPDAALLGGRPGSSLPGLRSAAQPPPRRRAATAGRQGTALQAPTAARTRYRPGKTGAPQPGLPTCPPPAQPASTARTSSAGKPAQHTTVHRQHAPSRQTRPAGRPGLGTQHDLPRVDRICREEDVPHREIHERRRNGPPV